MTAVTRTVIFAVIVLLAAQFFGWRYLATTCHENERILRALKESLPPTPSSSPSHGAPPPPLSQAGTSTDTDAVVEVQSTSSQTEESPETCEAVAGSEKSANDNSEVQAGVQDDTTDGKPLVSNAFGPPIVTEPLYLGAALMLVGEQPWTSNKACTFEMSMTALEKHWRPSNNYPVVLLNTRPWPIAEMEHIRNQWPTLDIWFENIVDIFQKYPGADFKENPKEIGRQFPFGYRRMCAFFIKGFTEIPLLHQFRYLMRLDDDTCIENNINFDMFAEMRDRGMAYAYQGLIEEHREVSKGMYSTTTKFMKTHNLTWSNRDLHAAWKAKYKKVLLQFTTNWEIIDFDRYRQPDIAAYSDALLATGHIFDRRWGDAPARFLVALLFWSPTEVLRICEFGYTHGNWDFKFYMCGHRSSDNPALQSMKRLSNEIHLDHVASKDKIKSIKK